MIRRFYCHMQLNLRIILERVSHILEAYAYFVINKTSRSARSTRSSLISSNTKSSPTNCTKDLSTSAFTTPAGCLLKNFSHLMLLLFIFVTHIFTIPIHIWLPLWQQNKILLCNDWSIKSLCKLKSTKQAE